MKRIYTVAFALMVLLSMTMGVTALQWKSMSRQNGISAYAGWYKIEDGMSTETFLSVTKTDYGTDIYASIYTYDMAGTFWSNTWGYTFTTEDVFSMDKKLDSASLKEVNMDLYKFSCDETMCWDEYVGTATVDADWTGAGDILRGSYKWTSKSGDFIMKGSDSSTYRDARATGSMDDQDLGTSSYASLGKFKSASMSMQK